MFKYTIKKFSNGLRLLMVPSKESLSFQIMVLVNTGADFETKKNNGISHFLEHMCFKGTKKRPSNYEITKEFDRVGGGYNAFTGSEVTGYYGVVSTEYRHLAMDIIADIYLNPLFPDKEIVKEKKVVIEEINMYNDDPKSYVEEIFLSLLYGDQPAGWPLSGTKRNVLSFTKKDLLRYHQSQYKSQSSLVVVSGKFQNNEIVESIRKYFQGAKKGKRKNKIKTREKQSKPQLAIEYRKTEQTHLILGVRTFNFEDKRKYALDILNTILSGGMSFRLFQLVREKLGAAYYINSSINSFSDRGFWAISAGINTDRLFEVLSELLKELRQFKMKLLDIKEIEKAKDNIKGKIALYFENVHHAAYSYAYDLLLKNKIETPEEYLKKIKEVNASQLKDLANQVLKNKNLNLAIIGPIKNKKPLLNLLKI